MCAFFFSQGSHSRSGLLDAGFRVFLELMVIVTPRVRFAIVVELERGKLAQTERAPDFFVFESNMRGLPLEAQ